MFLKYSWMKSSLQVKSLAQLESRISRFFSRLFTEGTSHDYFI
jgi:hypothetical protein